MTFFLNILSKVVTFGFLGLILFGLPFLAPYIKKAAEPVPYQATETPLPILEKLGKITPTIKIPVIDKETPAKEKIKNIENALATLRPETSTATPPNIPETNLKVRESTVNILCSTNFSPFKAITATGVIIDPRGVIITNAHVGQYFLLKNYAGPNSIDCVVRTGSPARPKYRGDLIFISPKWIEKNKNNLKEETPLGTGENDFAFIVINKKINGEKLAEKFPHLEPETEDSNIDREKKVDHIVAGYPAGFLGASAVEQNLYTASAVSKIQEIFTFQETTVDLVSLGGNVVAQKGSSGGAVFSSDKNKLLGLIVTTTDAKTTGERDLRAITLSHVNRSLSDSTGKGIKGYLSANLDETLSLFNKNSFPQLSQILKDVLSK